MMDVISKDNKKAGLKNLVLLLIAGVLILLCSLPELLQGGKSENTMNGTEYNGTGQVSPVPTPTEEERLEALLHEIEGVGKVESMICFSKPANVVVEGVVVVAEGVGNSNVAQNISDAIEALFGIPKHKIIILPMR